MKRTSAQSVGDIINQVLRQERLDVRLDEQRALAMWPTLVGQGVNRYTTDRSVKDGVLTFTIAVPLCATNLCSPAPPSSPASTNPSATK